VSSADVPEQSSRQQSVSDKEANKILSYRRDTALQGALVLAKSGGRLELGDNILRDIIGLSSTTVT